MSEDNSRNFRRKLHDMIRSFGFKDHEKAELHIKADQLPETELEAFKKTIEEKFQKPIEEKIKDDDSPERKLKIEMHDLVKLMNRDQNEKQQIHIQIEQFSATELDTLYEQIKQIVQTPREQSQQISEEKTEPHHIGEKTPEVLQQEAFSLANTKPAFRDKEWQAKWESVNEQINNLKNVRLRTRIQNKVKALLDGEQ